MSPKPAELFKSTHDSILVDTLLIEKGLGRQAQSGWKSAAWAAVVDALAAANVVKTTQQCKNRWQRVSGAHIPTLLTLLSNMEVS
jgi:hypothetical protein